MTLVQMAKFITDQMGLFDAFSTQLAREFLNKEYTVLWDKYPWMDTSAYASSSTAPFPLNGTIPYPDGIERIITIRAWELDTFLSASGIPRMLEPIDGTFLIETDPSIFEETGLVKYYEDVSTSTEKAIRLYPQPTIYTSFMWLGKRACSGLINDDDTVLVRNLEGAVIAYAHFDMLQRQRQFGKAIEKRKEAAELEQDAWNLEQQQANRPRRSKATTVAGNSLAEMTDAVCTICGQWTQDYRLIIREFLRRNYQTLYDTFLWPESLVMVRVPYTTEQVIMPHYIDKVLGIRGTTNLRMFPADAGLFLDISPSIFDEIGDPIGYTTLTPVAVSTLPPATTQLNFASTSAADRTKVFIRGEIIASGQELEEELTLNGTTPVTSVNVYDIPLTVAKGITLGNVTVNATADGRLLETIPANQRELKHQRLWFLPNPDSSTLTGDDVFTCLVLGKRAIKPLLTDQDTPIITGAQQVLIASAAADLFRKLEKPDQANAFQQKAGGSTDVLKAKNTDQAASAPRFVPQVEPRAYIAGGIGCGW